MPIRVTRHALERARQRRIGPHTPADLYYDTTWLRDATEAAMEHGKMLKITFSGGPRRAPGAKWLHEGILYTVSHDMALVTVSRYGRRSAGGVPKDLRRKRAKQRKRRM